MDEIEFRGLALGNKKAKWVYGVPIFSLENTRILGAFELKKGHPAVLVEKETIGQYIGLKDKNGKKIYTGDIVKTEYWYHGFFGGPMDTQFIDKYFIGQVQYWSESHAAYHILDKDGGGIPVAWACHKNDCWRIYGEVIGNIYQNKDLLK